MMSIALIIATFEEEDMGHESLQQLKQLAEDDEYLVLHDTALIVKTEAGQVEVEDPEDVDPKRGALFGAITGALLGALGGGVTGAVAGGIAGAATGGIAAKLADYGIPDRMIRDVEQRLQPGSAAIIAYVELSWLETAKLKLEDAGAVVVYETLESDFATKLIEDSQE